MKEGFKSVDEILAEVAKEEGMSLTEIRDVWDHQKKYIKKQMDTEGVYAIFLPFIGTLSVNTKQFNKEIRHKTKEFYESFTDKVRNLKKHVNFTEYGNAHKKVTGVNRLTRYIISNYDTGLDKSKNILIHYKCWDIIMKYSNGVFKKRDKTITRNKK